MKRFYLSFFLITLIFVGALAWFNQELLYHKFDQLTYQLLGPAAYVEPDPIELSPGSANSAPGSPAGIQSGIADLALDITAGAAHDYDKLAAVYDWVTANISYDLEKLKDISAYGSGAEYVLGTGKGVCHDYAELTRALLTAAGIEATYESGDVYPAPGQTERHAWNHALVDGIWYALDTTWGAGFILNEEDRFVQKPRRLYLTTVPELYRLHRDPAYKEEREQQYMRDRAQEAAPVYLSDFEQHLVASFNLYRSDRELPALAEEAALRELARQSAARIAENVSQDQEFSLEELREQLNRRAREFRIKSAGMYAFVQWSYAHLSSEELYRHIAAEQHEHLDEAAFRTVAVGVVRKADLTTVVHIYVEHY